MCVEIVELLFVFLCMLKFNLKFTGLFFKNCVIIYNNFLQNRFVFFLIENRSFFFLIHDVNSGMK